MKYTLSLAGFFLAFAVMVVPTAPVLASETENSESLQDAATELKTNIQNRVTEIEDLKESGASNIEIRLTEADAILDTTEANILEAKAYIPYVLFLNTQEKRAVYSLTTALLGQVRVYHEEVRDIKADLEASTITDEEANTRLNTLVDDTAEYLTAHKEDFSKKVKQSLKLRVKAAKAYIGFGIDFAEQGEEAYEDLGYSTTAVETALTKAQTAYDQVDDLYAAGIDGTDDDIQQLRNAAVQLIKARRQLSKAEYRLLTFENDWAVDHQ